MDTLFFYIFIIPSTSSTDDASINKINIGAIYLIITVKSVRFLALAEISISSVIVLTLTTYPIKIQVKNATIGISTLFEIKSKKSKNCILNIFTSAQML